MSTVVKFSKLTKPTTGFTSLEVFGLTIENDVLQYAAGAQYNNLKAQLPAMLSDSVPELNPDAFADTALFDHYASILKAAARDAYAKELDTVFRRIGIVWPDTLKISSMTAVEKIKFFEFLTEQLDTIQS